LQITLTQRRIRKHHASRQEADRNRKPDRRRKPDGGGRGCRSARYAQQAACLEGNDGATVAGHSVKGSENGAYEGRIRRGRLPGDVISFTRPRTPMARHPADDTLPRQHLILRRPIFSRRRMHNTSWRLLRCSARDTGRRRRRRRRRRPWKVGLDYRFS
jgi:hypothetical protein